MSDINRNLFEFFFGLTGRNGLLDSFGIFLANTLPYLMVLGFLVFAIGHKNWKLRWLILAEGAMATILSRGIITEAIRFFYHNPRPFVALSLSPLITESSYSFPSGHAVFFFALAMTIFYHNRRLGWWYFALSLINGLARIFVGVHWPLDIAGGIVLGIFSGFIVHQLIKPYLRQITTTSQI